MNRSKYEDIFFTSEDGTRIHARDYKFNRTSPHTQKLPVLCLHGLTRNCRDFEPMIAALNPNLGIRYIVADQRGRGLSEFSSPDSYSPVTYAQDMWALVNFLEIEEFLIIGTSMGGIISMLMSFNTEQAHRIKGICLNDIGAILEPAGLENILGYLGKNRHADNWQQAVDITREHQRKNFPDFSEEDWLDFVKRIYRQEHRGTVCLDYDPAISGPVRLAVEASEPNDLWPFFEKTYQIPTLIVRGALSDLLSRDVVTRMKERHPLAEVVEVANRGHAPILDEPAAVSNIEFWIERCNKQQK